MCHRPSALLVSTGTPSWGRGVGGTEGRCNSSHAPHAPSLSLHRGLPLSEAAVFPRVTSCAHTTCKHLSTWHSHMSSHMPHACSPCTLPMFPYVTGHTVFTCSTFHVACDMCVLSTHGVCLQGSHCGAAPGTGLCPVLGGNCLLWRGGPRRGEHSPHRPHRCLWEGTAVPGFPSRAIVV